MESPNDVGMLTETKDCLWISSVTVRASSELEEFHDALSNLELTTNDCLSSHALATAPEKPGSSICSTSPAKMNISAGKSN